MENARVLVSRNVGPHHKRSSQFGIFSWGLPRRLQLSLSHPRALTRRAESKEHQLSVVAAQKMDDAVEQLELAVQAAYEDESVQLALNATR
jgi:hypothetical protein